MKTTIRKSRVRVYTAIKKRKRLSSEKQVAETVKEKLKG